MTSTATRPTTSAASIPTRLPTEAWVHSAAAAQIHGEQLRRVELFNGRAAMLGFVIGVLTEALPGQGILHQIGLGTLLSQG
jgi:hypothetical protein